jgi:hypothetical protein
MAGKIHTMGKVIPISTNMLQDVETYLKKKEIHPDLIKIYLEQACKNARIAKAYDGIQKGYELTTITFILGGGKIE